MQRIILVGLQGSGKNTVGERLIQEHGYTGISFADALKNSVSAIFCWDRDLLEGVTPESRVWRETVDQWWAERLGIPNFTPRWMLRNFGTEIMRQHFNKNIWITNVERRILDLGAKPVVVLDGRFPNEIELVADKLGGQSVCVMRGERPEYWDLARAANRGDLSARVAMSSTDVHESEWAWIGHDFDAVLQNNSTIADLWQSVDDLIGTQ